MNSYDGHVLVVEVDAAPGEIPEWDFTVECPGATDQCRSWEECGVSSCSAYGGADSLYDNDMREHGQEHQYINDVWMVRTDRCHLNFDPSEAAERAVVRLGLGSGRYAVTSWDFDDGVLAAFEVDPRPLAPREAA